MKKPRRNKMPAASFNQKKKTKETALDNMAGGLSTLAPGASVDRP